MNFVCPFVHHGVQAPALTDKELVAPCEKSSRMLLVCKYIYLLYNFVEAAHCCVVMKIKKRNSWNIGIHSSGKFSGETFFKRFRTRGPSSVIYSVLCISLMKYIVYITDEGPRVQNV